MESWSSFGQRIDLAVRIRDILQDYPEGTNVLKELVQVLISSWFQACPLDINKSVFGQ